MMVYNGHDSKLIVTGTHEIIKTGTKGYLSDGTNSLQITLTTSLTKSGKKLRLCTEASL